MKIKEGYILIHEMDGSNTAVYVGNDTRRPMGFVKLNSFSTFLWKNLTKECTMDELVKAVTSEYAVDEKTAAEDVGAFVDKLISERILEDISRSFTLDTKHKAYYLLVAKAACSSVKASMYTTVYPDDYSIHKKHDEDHIKGVTVLTDEQKNWDSFTFVRNPFDRLVSAYESKYHNDVKMGNVTNSMSMYLEGYFAEDVGFEAFSRRVCQIPALSLNLHFNSQYMQTHYPNGKPVVKYIGRYETINEEFPAIAEKHGYRQLPHYNNSGGNKRDWRDYYNLETAELVHEKYKKDFEVFGYEDSYRELMEYLCKNKK